MTKKIDKILIIALFSTFLWPNSGLGKINTMTLIDQDLRSGELSLETSLLYKTYALFDPVKLPAKYHAEQRFFKSGTSVANQVRLYWDKLSDRTKSELATYYAPPLTTNSYPSPSGYFKIHYNISGRDAVDATDLNRNDVPDYVEKAASIFDSVYTLEVEQLGYLPPVSDGNAGGDSKYDVYITSLATQRVYGYTTPDKWVGPGNSYTSYIEIDKNYQVSGFPTRGLDALRITAAHEFFHAIQFSYYNSNDVIWWQEVTATWMEDVAYNNVNDYYNYLSYFFDYPNESLDLVNNAHEYGTSVFAHYLAKVFGQDIVKKLWEEIRNKNRADLEVFDSVIPGGFKRVFPEFAKWNYFTGSRAVPSEFYPEGDSYPEVAIESDHIHSLYPTQGSGSADHLGASYVSFTPTRNSTGGLEVEFIGSKDSWEAEVVGFHISPLNVNPAMFSATKVTDWNRFDEIILILSVVAKIGANYTYSYRALYNPALTDSGVSKIAVLGQNQPNPFRIDIDQKTIFPFELKENADVQISIYSLSGELVRKIPDQPKPFLAQIAPLSLEWDGKNSSGRMVGSGIYIYRIEAGGFVDLKKLVVVR